MTRLIVPGIKQPWKVIITDFGFADLGYSVEIWHIARLKKERLFHTRAAAENWAREKARELRIVRNGEAR